MKELTLADNPVTDVLKVVKKLVGTIHTDLEAGFGEETLKHSFLFYS